MIKIAHEHFEMAARAWTAPRSKNSVQDQNLLESFAEILAIECEGREDMRKENSYMVEKFRKLVECLINDN